MAYFISIFNFNNNIFSSIKIKHDNTMHKYSITNTVRLYKCDNVYFRSYKKGKMSGSNHYKKISWY